MNIKNCAAKVAAVSALPLLVSTASVAQGVNITNLPGLSYAQSTSRQTWKTVGVISAVVLVAGLVDSNGALILIGGAGLLLALNETGGNLYRQRTIGGLELWSKDSLSFGVRPFDMQWSSQDMRYARPNFVLQAKFKF